MERVLGFEILPAPFVIAHLQLGLLLRNLGTPFLEERGERAGIYLTNALTGWEPPEGPKPQVLFPELEKEREAAEKVKQKAPILVILGNPPYNAFAGVSPKEERGLVEPYKKGLRSDWGIKKFNLDDLYIRFFRLAERRIAEMTGKGVVCFITNFSYLSDPSFVVVRQRFVGEFDELWFDCMNGDSRETGKLTPDGRPDPSVFSTEYNRAGIRVGTAVSLMVRRTASAEQGRVRFRHFWGANKRADLLQSLNSEHLNADYHAVDPSKRNRFSFRSVAGDQSYWEWPSLPKLAAQCPSNGLMEKRGGALIDIDREPLEKRMRMYFDPAVEWTVLSFLGTGLTRNAAAFDAKRVRAKALAAEQFWPARIRRYAVRPFEVRWCYYSEVSPIWNRCRPSLSAQCWQGNSFLVSRFKASKRPEGPPFYFLPAILSDDHLLSPDAFCFPIRVRVQPNSRVEQPAQEELLQDFRIEANLSKRARSYLKSLGSGDPDKDEEVGSLIWTHALAIGYSPAYLEENRDGIRQDWPRIPLPNSKEVLGDSARLGARVAELLVTEHEVPTLTSGEISPGFRPVGVIAHSRGENQVLNPAEGHLRITAGWGHRSKDGVIMPPVRAPSYNGGTLPGRSIP